MNGKKAISWTTMAILTATAVASVRGLPAMAVYGWGSIGLYIIPAILFMVPIALVAAELASGWKGGVFVWVKEAYGDRIGFSAIWQQWIQNVVWYPAQLAFFASALAYVFDPASPAPSSWSSTGSQPSSPSAALKPSPPWAARGSSQAPSSPPPAWSSSPCSS